MEIRRKLRAENLYYRARKSFLKGNIKMARMVSILNKALNCCDISFKADIGEGIYISHAIGLVIAPGVVIGENCHLHQNTSIGNNQNKNPVIENDVTIYPHSIIAGDYTIKQKSIVPAGSVLITKSGRVFGSN